jgi:serine/threonine protein phosphatase PrpC
MTQPGSTTSLKLEFAQATDPGRDPNKQVNEDACGYKELAIGHVIVLCDGMGGHYGGQEASRTAITTIFELLERAPSTANPAATLKAALEEAGRRVYRIGGPPENVVRPGSTVVAMIAHDRGLDVAHLGDSRAYIVRSGQIYPLTRDHSMVQAMIDAGTLTEAQAMGHPDSNKITRALGMKVEVDVDVRPEPMELFAGDLLITASDGLTDLALGAEILGVVQHSLASGSLDSACTQLIQLANHRGGHDNITVQLARVTSTSRNALTRGPVEASAAAPPGAAPATRVMTAPGATHGPPSSERPTTAFGPSAGVAAAISLPQAAPSGGNAPRATLDATASGVSQVADSLASMQPSYPLPLTQVGYDGLSPTSQSPSSSRAAQGAVLYLILGLFAVIGILSLALIWALFLR